MKFSKLALYLLLALMSEIFSYPVFIQAQEVNSQPTAADICVNNEPLNRDSQIINDTYGKNWITYSRAEAHLAELDKKCLALAPSLPTYYGYASLHQTKTDIMLAIVGAYEMASTGAICAHREDLFALYDKKATQYVELLKQQPPGSISDPPVYMGFHTHGNIEMFKSVIDSLHYHPKKCPL